MQLADIAKAPSQTRADLFQIIASELKIPAPMVEKDFWVCFVLDFLFQYSQFKGSIVFKGGTSLSKCYKLIDRFSEDIDLILDWRALGYSLYEPWNERSNSAQEKFKAETIALTDKYLREVFVPNVKAGISAKIECEADIFASGEEETVVFRYPREFEPLGTLSSIRLEIGPLAAWTPSEDKEVVPYIAERRPALFTGHKVHVVTVKPERTFWEKATILHQEAHRPENKAMPRRYSRHYYDLYQMGRSFVKEEALCDRALLTKVVEFKEKFYRTPWSKLTEAKGGKLRLVPPRYRMEQLKEDYIAMEAMIFGEIPSFDKIIEYLSRLEAEINEASH